MLSEASRDLLRTYARARDDRPSPPSVAEFSTQFSPGTKPLTVVLLPALFVGDWLWEPVQGQLTDAGWPVIRFHEAVSLIDRTTARSITRLADALSRACRRHTDGPLVVCGDSLGALIAMEFARTHPAGTAALVVSGAPGLDRAAERLGRELITGAAGPRDLADRFLHHLLYQPDSHGIDADRYARLVDDLATPERLATMLAGLRAIRGYDVRGLLPRLAVPTLFVWGRHDLITPVQPWQDLVTQLPDARLAVFEHCGHAPMFEKPDEFYAELSVTLAECARRLAR